MLLWLDVYQAMNKYIFHIHTSWVSFRKILNVEKAFFFDIDGITLIKNMN